MSGKSRNKAKVIREDVKDRHTSHWDLDYLSLEELDRLMTMERPQAGEEPVAVDKLGTSPAK